MKEKKPSQSPTEWQNRTNCKIIQCNCENKSAKRMQWNCNRWNTEKKPNKIKYPDIWNCCSKSMWQLQSLSEVSVWGPEQMTVSRNLVMKHSKFRQRHRITPMNDMAQSYRIIQTWWWQRWVIWNTMYSTPVQSLRLSYTESKHL